MAVGGGFKSIRYTLRAAREVGVGKMLGAISSKNTCKTCALGMGGQKGGMVNEEDEFPEICKKSFQAHITDIQPAIPESFFKETSVDALRNTRPIDLERLGRLNSPLYKREESSHYETISWDEALQKIIQRFQNANPDRSFFYSSGRSSNEAAFILQLFARVFGCNHVNNCSYYCHQASGVGLNATIGSGTATVRLADLDKADIIFVIGANPASNHPRFMKKLMECRRRGGHVVVVNPAKENGLVKFAVPSDMISLFKGGSDIASHYLQPHIGGDIALLKGIAKAVLEKGSESIDFIEKYTEQYLEYKEDLADCSWESIEKSSGLSRVQIEEIADLYSQADNVIFSWAMGITHHKHGVENVESIVNLSLLRGMIGRPNAGLLPLRGHSNVQGIGTVGVTPALKEQVLRGMEEYFDISISDKPGMDTMACMRAAMDGKVDQAFFLGGNLYASNPDSQFAENALNQIPFKVFLSTTLNQGHCFGVKGEAIILPVKARDEEDQSTSQESMFNYVRLSDGGTARLDKAKSEVEIIATLADGIVQKRTIDFTKFLEHNEIRKAIADIIPGMKSIAQLGETKAEFEISNRVIHDFSFNTPSKKARFSVCDVPQGSKSEYPFKMMSVRSEGQFNSVIYEEEDAYRDQVERWIVLMNSDDMQSLGVQENDLVDLQSTTGIMKKVKVRRFDITSGNVMTYYPESNVLISNDTDPRSLTPSFKNVGVNIMVSSGE